MIRIEKRLLVRVILVPLAVAGFVCAYDFFSQPQTTSVAAKFVGRIFGQLSMDSHGVYVLVAENLLFISLFQLLFATYFSSHFRIASVYIFTRVQSRFSWYLSRVVELAIYAVIYTFFYCLAVTIVAIRGATQPLICADVKTIGEVWLLAMFFALELVTLSGLLSIRFGSAVSILLVQGTCVVLMILAIELHGHPVLSFMNPLSFLDVLEGNTWVRLGTTAYHAILLTIIQFLGAWYIERYDIALSDAELG